MTRQRSGAIHGAPSAVRPMFNVQVCAWRWCAVALMATGLVVAGVTRAATRKPVKPKKPVQVPTMPHVNVCHPDVCFPTQKAHDEYACMHACQWDDPLDAQNDPVIQFEYTNLQTFEGDVPWMYLDSNGYVTVGVGHLIANAKDAEALPFYDVKTGKKATKAEIDAAFAAVSAATPGMPSHAYQGLTGIVMHESDIQNLVVTQLNSFTADLKQWFPDYENYPAKARAALLDMAYNPGKLGLLSGWPTLVAATRAYNWQVAADQSARKPHNKERDATIKSWFEDAANWEVSALAKRALCGVQPPDQPPSSGPVSSGPVVAPAAEPARAGSPARKIKEH